MTDTPTPPQFGPTGTVLVPAFNEADGIADSLSRIT
jgi:hypothetical protein